MKKLNIKGFEGLRVFAISMVIACHVGALASTSGGIGNKIFFVLSGFLAYFSTRNITDFYSLLQFYAKKIIRIVPTYWLVILAVWRMLPGTFSLHDFSTDQSLILNLFFVKSYAHLWFLQQIMLMYLCAPLLYIFVKWLKKTLTKYLCPTTSWFLCAVVLVILALLEKRYFTADIFALSGAETHAQFQIWMFMFGFASACIYEAWVSSGFSPKAEQKRTTVNILTDIYLICFCLTLFFFVIPSCHEKYPYVAAIMDSELLRTLLSCMAVLMLCIAQESYISKLLSLPLFKIISDISYGIYIVHFFLLGYFHTEYGIQNFISNFLISMCIAYFIYNFWENPMAAKLKNSTFMKGEHHHV